jgi:hypothetical protein
VRRTVAAMAEQADTGEERTLSVRLDLHLDREPITGLLRTERGEEQFVGWLGFVDALKRLNELEVDANRKNSR